MYLNTLITVVSKPTEGGKVKFDEERNEAMISEILGLLQNPDVNHILVLTTYFGHSIKKLPFHQARRGAAIQWYPKARIYFDEKYEIAKQHARNAPGFPRTYTLEGAFCAEFEVFHLFRKEPIEQISICMERSPNFDLNLHHKLKFWQHMEAVRC